MLIKAHHKQQHSRHMEGPGQLLIDNSTVLISCYMIGSGDISSVMGFSGFGKVQKTARKFDLDAMFEKTKREAKTILSHNGTYYV